jgi:hypothetical protein
MWRPTDGDRPDRGASHRGPLGASEHADEQATQIAAARRPSHLPAAAVTELRTVTEDTKAKLQAGDQSGATNRIKDLETTWDDDQPTLERLDTTQSRLAPTESLQPVRRGRVIVQGVEQLVTPGPLQTGSTQTSVAAPLPKTSRCTPGASLAPTGSGNVTVSLGGTAAR